MARRAIEPHPGMSQAVRIGRQIHLSGQVSLDERGEKVAPGDAEAQARARSSGTSSACWRQAGASLDDVALLTCYLTDAAHFPAYSAVKQEIFPGEAPAGTTVIVAGLLDPDFLLEVEAVASLD